jgi:hypothetical protein
VLIALLTSIAIGGPAIAQKQPPKLNEVVKIEFPKHGYTLTLAEAAKGVKLSYKIVVERDVEGMIPLPFGPSFREPAGPSGLHPREVIAGNKQFYGLIDSGLAQPPREVPRTIKKGTYTHTFEWDGRNWSGPSDTAMPKGNPFPAGTYEVTVTLHGKLRTEQGVVPYQITQKAKLTLK